MFTSREPGQFPRDPEPHRVDESGQRLSEGEYRASAKSDNDILYQLAKFDPRPEFNTPVNPILQNVRLGVDTVEGMLDYLEDGFGATARNDGLFELDEIEHARKVLTRLVVLDG